MLIMENPIEKKMDDEMETGVMQGSMTQSPKKKASPHLLSL